MVVIIISQLIKDISGVVVIPKKSISQIIKYDYIIKYKLYMKILGVDLTRDMRSCFQGYKFIWILIANFSIYETLKIGRELHGKIWRQLIKLKSSNR